MTLDCDPEVGVAVLCFLYLHWYPDNPRGWDTLLSGATQFSGLPSLQRGNPAILHAKIFLFADRWLLDDLKNVAYRRFLVAFATLNRCRADNYIAADDSKEYNIFDPSHHFTGKDRDLMDIIFQELMSDKSLRDNQDMLRVFLYGLVRFRESGRGNSLAAWYRQEDLAVLLAPVRTHTIDELCGFCAGSMESLAGCEHEGGCEHSCNFDCQHFKGCDETTCYANSRKPISCQVCLRVTDGSVEGRQPKRRKTVYVNGPYRRLLMGF